MWERIKNLIGKYGLFGTLRLCAARTAAQLRAAIRPELLLRRRRVLAQLRALLAGEHRRVVLWRSGFGYHTALFQRPQQIARQLARLRVLMIYEADPLLDRIALWEEEEPGLVLVNLRCGALRRLLLREIGRLDCPKTLQLYSTDWRMKLSELRRFQSRSWEILYEYVDALSPAVSGTAKLPRRIQEKFGYVMSHPEIFVAATSDRLYADVLNRRGEARLIMASNGVDNAFFQQWERCDFEPGFQAILAREKPVLLYYGAMASWLDYELLKQIAAAGLGSLVLIGAVYDASFDRELRSRSDVDFLGPRDYRALKYYAREADVLLLPFRISELTRAASPVKLFEYMALKKPIVSTDVDEARKYRSVLIGSDREDFLRKIKKALSLRGDENYLAMLERDAGENDWSEKAKAILDGLDMKKPPA